MRLKIHVWQLPVFLFIALFLATSAVIALSRSNRYVCFQAQNSADSKYYVLDTESGGIAPLNLPDIYYADDSPDKRYWAYQETRDNLQWLVVVDYATGQHIFVKTAQWMTFGWSPESKLAYLWGNPDENVLHVALAEPDGRDIKTAAFPLTNLANNFLQVSFGNFSGDETYISFQVTLSSGSTLPFMTDFNKLVQADGSQLGTWSPTGHYYVTAEMVHGFTNTVIDSPDGSVQPYSFPSGSGNLPGWFTWSGDGRYVTDTYWQDNHANFDILGIDGQSHIGIRGEIETNGLLSASWSSDLTTWLFLQQSSRSDTTVYNLAAFHPGDKTYHVLMTGVVAPASLEPPAALDLTGAQIAVPVWQGTKMAMQLLNRDGSESTSLAVGADNVSAPSWSPDHQIIAFIADIGLDEQLIWARADGTDQYVIHDPHIRLISWLDPQTLLFVHGSSNRFSVEALDVQTGERHSLMTNVPIQSPPDDWTNWTVYSLPDHKHVILSKYNCYDCMDMTIYLVSLDSQSPQTLASGGEIGVTWSPDGKRIALLTPAGLDIFDMSGTKLVSDAPLGQTPGVYTGRWTQCN